MSEILTSNQNYYDIADTIRQMKNVNTTYKPRQMASALKNIYSNEVEGTLPLIFEANGNNLLDYRIDGASGGVGDRTKNILINNLETQTYKGITLTVNADKSVTLNGTATESFNFVIYSNSHTLYPNDYQPLENGIYIVSGTPIGAEVNSYYMSFRYAKIDGSSSLTRVPPNGVQIDNSTGNYGLIALYITVWSGVTINNVIFKPMIRLSTETSEYEQPGYKLPVICGGTTTNIYLNNPILENESISLSDTNVNIPTVDGINTLTIGTTVQPSNVYIQAPKDSIEAIQIANRLEEI